MSATGRAWTISAAEVDVRRGDARAHRTLRLASLPQDLVVDLDRTALIVVDMQNDFCSVGGWLETMGADITPAEEAIVAISRLAPVLRSEQVPIVWVNWGNRIDQRNLPPGVTHVYDQRGAGHGIGRAVGSSPAVLTRGSWGAAIVDRLEPCSSDILVDKYRMSGFFDTPLDSILRHLDIDTLLFAGVNADQCVLATLTDAANLGYDVVLLEQASATTSPDFCLAATLYNVRQCFGFTAEADDVIAALERLPVPLITTNHPDDREPEESPS